MTKYLLDTNICIYILKRKPIEVYYKFTKFDLGDIAISVITLAELYHGVKKSIKVKENQSALEEFLKPFQIVEFDYKSALTYGEIKNQLERKGNIIGTMDLLISAIAISNNLTLISNNIKEFERIESLKLDNWV